MIAANRIKSIRVPAKLQSEFGSVIANLKDVTKLTWGQSAYPDNRQRMAEYQRALTKACLNLPKIKPEEIGRIVGEVQLTLVELSQMSPKDRSVVQKSKSKSPTIFNFVVRSFDL